MRGGFRAFDVDDHDVARTCPERWGFLTFLDEMFLQGRVFDDVLYGDEVAASSRWRIADSPAGTACRQKLLAGVPGNPSLDLRA